MLKRFFSISVFLSLIAYGSPVASMTLHECLAQSSIGNFNEYRARRDQCKAQYGNSPEHSKPAEARSKTPRIQREAKPEKALEKAEEARAALPSTTDQKDVDLAMCAERSGEKSVGACSRVIASGRLKGNDLATVYVLRAMTNRNAGEYGHAITDFAQAIEILEKFAASDVIATAYVARANAYLLNGDLENAGTDYRHAHDLDPKNEQAAEAVK